MTTAKAPEADSLTFRHWSIRPVTIPRTLDNVPEGVEAVCWGEDVDGNLRPYLLHTKGPHCYMRTYTGAVAQLVACASAFQVDEACWKAAHNIKETYNSISEVPDYRVLCRIGTGELKEGRLLVFRAGDQWYHRRSCSPEYSADDCWETTDAAEVNRYRYFVTPYEAYREAIPMGFNWPVIGKESE